MLRFDVYDHGSAARTVNLDGAYLFGQDAIPVRAELAARDGQIQLTKRPAGAAGLAILRDAGAAGVLLLPTTRLPTGNKTYHLNLELARARMMLIARKREEWGLSDYPATEDLVAEFDRARELFIQALQAEPDDPGRCATLADECLARGVLLSERMARFHADVLLARRRRGNGRIALGCRVDPFSHSEAYRQRLLEAFDMVSLPVPWKHVEPKERQTQFQQFDTWTEWCLQRRLPIQAGPLVSFEPRFAPEWLYIWEHDYETLRDLIYEYVQRVVTRYAKRVRTWNVVSGLHAYNSFNLSFEQIMELTRMSCLLVRKLSPRSTVMIDLVLPWGEYYARNQRTIPPMMYADMCVQSGVKFDAFGVQVYFGAAADGMFVRDLMQVSDLLDGFSGFGKPLHVTGVSVPSDTAPDRWDAWQGQAHADRAGHWHRPWDGNTQADWLEAFCTVALSKPYVESVCWRDLADYEGHHMPHGGLCGSDLTPKPAYERLRQLRAALPRRRSEGRSEENS